MPKYINGYRVRENEVPKYKKRKHGYHSPKISGYAQILAKKAEQKKGTPEWDFWKEKAELASKGLSLEPKGLSDLSSFKLGGRKHITLNPRTVDEEKRKKSKNTQK